MNGMTSSITNTENCIEFHPISFSCAMFKMFNIVHSPRFRNKTTQSSPMYRHTHTHGAHATFCSYDHTQVLITTNYESFVKQLEAHGFPSFYIFVAIFFHSKNVFLLLPLLDSQKTCFMFVLIAIALILASLVVGKPLFYNKKTRNTE